MAKITPLEGMSNAYLIEGENGSVLVDTQTKGHREFLAKWLQDKNVKLIVLTHGHIDHVANAAYLSEKLGAPIGMHAADVPLIANSRARKLHANTVLGFFVKLFSWAALGKVAEPFTPAVFLKQGDTLRQYGIDAVVQELPGHTAGSIGLLVDGDQYIVGDAVMNVVYPTVSRIFEDVDQMLESAEKISQVQVKDIYPGHGKTIEK